MLHPADAAAPSSSGGLAGPFAPDNGSPAAEPWWKPALASWGAVDGALPLPGGDGGGLLGENRLAPATTGQGDLYVIASREASVLELGELLQIGRAHV